MRFRTGGDKAYELLRTVMAQEHKVAIATTVIGSTESLLAIMPTEDGLVVESMYFATEVRPMPKAYDKQLPSESELEMAKTLMNLMRKPFDHRAYRNEYQERVNKMIEMKILGEQIIIAPQPAEHSISNANP